MVPSAQPEACAEAIVRLIDDARLRTRLGDEGRRTVERMLPNDEAAAWIGALADVCPAFHGVRPVRPSARIRLICNSSLADEIAHVQIKDKPHEGQGAIDAATATNRHSACRPTTAVRSSSARSSRSLSRWTTDAGCWCRDDSSTDETLPGAPDRATPSPTHLFVGRQRAEAWGLRQFWTSPGAIRRRLHRPLRSGRRLAAGPPFACRLNAFGQSNVN